MHPEKAKFLSTPSGWRATGDREQDYGKPENFYPRPPGGGRRQIAIPGAFNIINFYPRPPGGGRQGDPNYYEYSPEISIHALRVEGDNLH